MNNYYSLKNILSKKCLYNIIIGERSNGKTYACLEYSLKKFFETGEQFAIIRRWQDDFKGKRGQNLFTSHINNGLIKKFSNNEWTDIYYYGHKWYLCKYVDDKRIIDNEPFAFAFALTQMEHDKSVSYPNITTIIFDEFLTRGMYLPDEFISFMNVISTIVRQRLNVLIFMLGNTVNKYSPYFSEMGLDNIKSQKSGTIDIYEYGDSGLKVAVEYCDTFKKTDKKSNIYFAFKNPKLHMITSGAWELNLYPHLSGKYKPKDVKLSYFIVFNDDILQCEVIKRKKDLFTFIHRKTTPLKNNKNDIIYGNFSNENHLHYKKISYPSDNITRKIWSFFQKDKVFFQDNEVGEIVRNYLLWCRNESILN